MRDLQLPFYLTGGTALSRYYLKHRFSDDLDLFVNSDGNYSTYVDQLMTRISSEEGLSELKLMRDRVVSTAYYTRFYITGHGTELKVDLVNDVPYHFGGFEIDESIGKLDSWRNILSNKLAALYRFEIKDFVDIWGLSRRFDFIWQEIVEEARWKEASVDPGEVSNLFRSFPFDRLEVINWTAHFDYSMIKEEFNTISDDIFYGKRNSLR